MITTPEQQQLILFVTAGHHQIPSEPHTGERQQDAADRRKGYHV
jgi:hypothetical protein